MNQNRTTVNDLGVKASEGRLAAQYVARTVGGGGFGSLLGYELYSIFAATVPGAPGHLLRKFLIRLVLKNVGANIIIGAHVQFRGTDNIKLGNGVMLDDFVLLDVLGPGSRGIDIGDDTMIERYSIISAGGHADSHVRIGRRCSLGPNVKVYGIGTVDIGDNTLIAHDSSLIAGQHIFAAPDTPIRDQGKSFLGIKVEEDVWIGAGVRVLDGVTLGKGCVIGTGSVVTKSIPPGMVAAGIPCRPLHPR